MQPCMISYFGSPAGQGENNENRTTTSYSAGHHYLYGPYHAAHCSDYCFLTKAREQTQLG